MLAVRGTKKLRDRVKGLQPGDGDVSTTVRKKNGVFASRAYALTCDDLVGEWARGDLNPHILSDTGT